MSVNPQIVNTINNTEQNTFHIVPTLSQLGQTIGENIAPTFTQGSGGPYFGESNTSSFNFTATGPATIPLAIAEFVKPTFTPSSTAGTLTIGNAIGLYSAPVSTPGSGGAVTNAYSLICETPTGAINNYTAFLGSTSSALVGIGTKTPHQALSVVGGVSFSVTTVTALTYTVLNTDNTLDVNAAGPVTLTLPAPSTSNRGQLFLIKDISGGAQTNPITVVTPSGTIDGGPSAVINFNYGFLQVYSDGSNYHLIRTNLGTLTLGVTNVITPTFTATNTQTILDVNHPGAVALTLPAASAANLGQLYIIKDTSGLAQTNPITINTLSGTIDGSASQVIGTDYGFLQVYSDGTNYYTADSNLASAPGFFWVNVTGTSQTLSVNTGYCTTNASATTLTLPTTAVVGSIIEVTGAGTGLWTIAQNAGQQIQIGNAATTAGTGSLASTSKGDTVELLCTVANTNFQVLDVIGNLVVS